VRESSASHDLHKSLISVSVEESCSTLEVGESSVLRDNAQSSAALHINKSRDPVELEKTLDISLHKIDHSFSADDVDKSCVAVELGESSDPHEIDQPSCSSDLDRSVDRVSVLDISSYPKVVGIRGVTSRKRKANAAELLTGSPFKNVLIERGAKNAPKLSTVGKMSKNKQMAKNLIPCKK